MRTPTKQRNIDKRRKRTGARPEIEFSPRRPLVVHLTERQKIAMRTLREAFGFRD